MAAPALADSRTATVRVSCTILPMIEIATLTAQPSSAVSAVKSAEWEMNSNGTAVKVDTNFGNKFTTSEATLQNQNGLMKVYSVTAL